VLVATAALADGAPAALQAWEGETLLSRLAAQFASLGIARLHVLTRTVWAEAVRAATTLPWSARIGSALSTSWPRAYPDAP